MIEISRELIFAEIGDSQISREFNFRGSTFLEDFKTQETRIVVVNLISRISMIWKFRRNFISRMKEIYIFRGN